MKKLIGVVLGLTLALFPALVWADDGTTARDDFLMRIRADVNIPAGEQVGSLVVIDGNAVIDGNVKNTVFVINGDVTVNGTIGGNLTVISGSINLGDKAQVVDVTSIRGDVVRAPGAVVTGSVRERDGFTVPIGVIGLFSAFFWAAMTVAVVVAGLVFAAIGGRQLTRAAEAMTNNAVHAILGVVFVWTAVPLLAVVAMMTLIGIPLGIGVMVCVLPALWFLGYIVAGARLGKVLTGAVGRNGAEGGHPYSATVVGLILFQLLVLVPVLGGLIALVAGIWGAGAIAFTAYRAAGGKSIDSTPTTQVPQVAQPAG